jgi:hypothetical protein
MFNVDFHVLAGLLTPSFLRKPKMLAWLSALFAPIITLHRRFTSARNDDLFRISIDSTVPRLEYLLNHTFYPAGLDTDYEHRIRIRTGKDINPKPLYLGGITQPINESKPQYLGTLYIHTHAETGVLNVDFNITVPASAQPYDRARMESLVRSYCLPDKTFSIVNQ